MKVVQTDRNNRQMLVSEIGISIEEANEICIEYLRCTSGASYFAKPDDYKIKNEINRND